MSKPTFIAIPILTNAGETIDLWINPEQISGFAEKYDGSAAIEMSSHEVYETILTYQELMRILRISGCRLLTRGDIDLIGDCGEEGVK